MTAAAEATIGNQTGYGVWPAPPELPSPPLAPAGAPARALGGPSRFLPPLPRIAPRASAAPRRQPPLARDRVARHRRGQRGRALARRRRAPHRRRRQRRGLGGGGGGPLGAHGAGGAGPGLCRGHPGRGGGRSLLPAVAPMTVDLLAVLVLL